MKSYCSLDVCFRLILVRWCPSLDDLPDNEQPILMIIGPGQQYERCSPTVIRCCKLAETGISHLFLQSLSLRFPPYYVQGIVIS